MILGTIYWEHISVFENAQLHFFELSYYFDDYYILLYKS